MTGKTIKQKDKDQLKLWVKPEIIDQLKAAAERAGGTLTHNTVAVEIVQRFLPAWEKLEELQQRGVEEYIQQLGTNPELVSQYLHKETNEGIGDLYRPPKSRKSK